MRIEGHEHEIRSLKHRMDSQEEESKSIQQLAVSVERIALSTEHIMQEQKEQGERLKVLEREPADAHRQIKMSVVTALISAVVGAAAAAVLVLL
ncbi:hypothetical protein D7X48_22385 [bacterium D16-50]|nr:hypothetical protein D7X48_22385 [bacterium D16-50]